MGKIRTKPRFYSYDTNTVGNITEIGNNQIDIHNISLNEVFAILSASGKLASRTIQVVCKAAEINKWAAFRPYPEIHNSRYGWGYNSITHEIFHYHGDSEGAKRLGDFAGYNHNAIPSRLLHNPSSQVYGEDYTTTDKNRIDDYFSIQFQFEEVSPVEVFSIPWELLYIYVLRGTSISSQVLRKEKVSDITLSNLLMLSAIPKGFDGYGQTTFSVWFGNDHLPQFRWKLSGQINNSFILLVKTYFTYMFEVYGFAPNFFNISVDNEDHEPESKTTFKFNSNLLMSAGDVIKIEASQFGGDWTLIEEITAPPIPGTYQVNWLDVYPSTYHTGEDSLYRLKVTYNSFDQ